MPRLRTILDLPSSLSLLSFATRSADDSSSIHSHRGTISTLMSTSTVGIGTTSAKVLVALGERAIQYAEPSTYTDILALSIIDLLLAAAHQSTESRLIFLEAGMLDILLYFYLDGDLNLDTQTAVQKACFDLAKVRPPDGRRDLIVHQILPLIASRPTKHYSYVSELAKRGEAWRLTRLSLVDRHFLTISAAVREDRWVIWGSEWIVDLVEFMR
ncbi:hypothetical protein PLEOSDRAFT_170126 [Pleurotus ostreatus PC15]|uniref:Uncharacterized protein n=1 Tax=Pleurotus ostreatus (strain PC15) TaxID=1137138 RepID=A0A067NA93_PLEO1|nr:hypothetical protein PLEOSDRAFT_170126 [Pleurotus ostreatus PC15]